VIIDCVVSTYDKEYNHHVQSVYNVFINKTLENTLKYKTQVFLIKLKNKRLRLWKEEVDRRWTHILLQVIGRRENDGKGLEILILSNLTFSI